MTAIKENLKNDSITESVENILENIVKKNQQEELENKKKMVVTPSKKKPSKKSKEIQVIPRGIPKSGRFWKEPKKKFSTIKKSIYRRPYEKKEELRNELKHIKEVSKSIKEAKKQEKELKKQRQKENAERRLANERKAEIVQIIKNPAKLKRLRKKQLRKIEKRDLDPIKAV